MDRQSSLEFVLECDDGGGRGSSAKPAMSAEPPAKAQATVTLPIPELFASSCSLTDESSKDKSGMLGGNMKQSQPGHVQKPPQDRLEFSSSKETVVDGNAKESGGMFSGLFKKSPNTKAASQVDLSAHSDSSKSNKTLPNTKDDLSKQSSISDGHTEKSAKNAVVEAVSKLNPFSSATKKDTEKLEDRKQSETKSNPVKSNMIQLERRKRSNAVLIPAEEEMSTSAHSRVQQKRTDEKKDESPGEMNPSAAPAVPVRPSEEEMSRLLTHQQKNNNQEQNRSGDEGNREDEEKHSENKTTRVIKHKHPNPFMPQVAPKAASDDERLKDESSSREERKEKTEEAKVKPKRPNPFMPQVKAKVIQRKAQDGAAGNTTENEAPSRPLLDQLEDLCTGPSQPEDNQVVEDLMDWWNTVDSWEDTRRHADDMTEKEEAKAFAVTAERVQKGIRVFNRLFSERAESLWQHVIDLNTIADSLDKFNKNTKIAQITGGSTSAIGGVATIAGLALAPVTMGTSLIVTAVGLSVATAGGLTSAGAGISNQVNNSMDRKKVEKIVEDYQEKIADLNKCLKFIKQGIENLRKFDLIKMKKHAYNQDFPGLTSQFYEDGAMAGKAILVNANEIMRVVQIANVAGSTAARAVQIASMATGVLTGLFVGMDIYFVAKDSKELKKGAKSEFAAKIREVAMQLHSGLVELNSIREELQSNRSESKNEIKDPDTIKKEQK